MYKEIHIGTSVPRKRLHTHIHTLHTYIHRHAHTLHTYTHHCTHSHYAHIRTHTFTDVHTSLHTYTLCTHTHCTHIHYADIHTHAHTLHTHRCTHTHTHSHCTHWQTHIHEGSTVSSRLKILYWKLSAAAVTFLWERKNTHELHSQVGRGEPSLQTQP